MTAPAEIATRFVRSFAYKFVLSMLLALALSSQTNAESLKPLKGVALVIGETKYRHLKPLDNPFNDAREIKHLLDDLGFEAREVIDRDGAKLNRDFERFLEDAEGADVALIYYSGHGIEAGGENWLVPVDADVSSLAQAEKSLISVSRYLKRLQETVPLTIVLLDACRSNPFPPDARLSSSTAEAASIGAGGLSIPAKGIILTPDTNLTGTKTGTVIGFSAEPGQVALDGPKGGTSPYAAALLKHLSAKGFDFGDVMTMVTQEVYVETQGRQRPWINQNLRHFLYFGTTSGKDSGDEEVIQKERRQLLLTIATTPDEKKRLVESLARNDQVPLAALYGMLNLLEIEGPRNPADLENQLRAGSERLKSLLAERRTLTSPDADITRLSALADEAVTEGAVKAATGFHEQVKARIAVLSTSVERAKADVKERELEFAEAFASSAKTNIIAFNFLTAAQDFKAAFDRAATWDRDLAFNYKLSEADALNRQGISHGNNGALEQAIAVYGVALAFVPEDLKPYDYARALNNLATALKALGERENGSATLEKAVTAFKAVLEKWPRSRFPYEWAMVQNNLGTALTVLGERESNTDRLNQAVRAYEAALMEWS